jgi:DNA-binding NtrC family response regulator
MTLPTTSRKTVLVAAETPAVRDRFKAALDAAGHHAVVVRSVAQLLARVHADLDELDLIVLDELGYLPFARSGGQLLFHSSANFMTSSASSYHEPRDRRGA